MDRTLVADLSPKLAGKEVLLNGWIASIRDLAKVKFVLLRDRTGTIQCVAPLEQAPLELFKKIPLIPVESAVEITGTLTIQKQAKKGFEIIIKNITVLGNALPEIPIDLAPKTTTHIDKRLDYRFLDTRRPETTALFKIRSSIVKHIVTFFSDHGFVNINTPKITVAGVESGAELFTVQYFDKQAYLAQSPQIYKQMFVIGGFERVYEIGEVFRAEKSHTTRHLTEFTGIDFEMGFIKDENDIMDIIEEMLHHVISGVKKDCVNELELLCVDLIIPKKIPRISIQEARKLLASHDKKVPENEDLDPEAERLMGTIVKEKYDSEFVFMTNYPFTKRPFYHMKPAHDPNGTRSFDLLWNGVEIATGAQREHRYDILKAQANSKGINLDAMESYATLFKYGAPPHGGVGFGLDRFTQRMLKLENIREAILLPRDTERLTP